MVDIRTMLEDFFGIVPGNSATDPPVFKKGIATPTTNASVSALDDLLNLVAPDKLETSITAHAGGTKAAAYQLSAFISNVTVCATAGDSVALPTAAIGKEAVVRNLGVANLFVYTLAAGSDDTINGMASSAYVIVPPGATQWFFATSGSLWYTANGPSMYLPATTAAKGGLLFQAIANTADYIVKVVNAAFGQSSTLTIPDPGAATANFVLSEGAQTIAGALTLSGITTLTGLLRAKVTSNITAGTTQTMAGATQLTSTINHVATCANANDGVALPTAAAGNLVLVKNAGANTLKIWPFNGGSDKINDGTVDTAITLATTKSVLLYAIDATNWYSIALD